MPCFILCPSCSNNLGEIIEFVTLARKGMVKKAVDAAAAHVSMISLSDGAAPPMGPILDAVGLTQERMCCRMHVMGASANE